MEKIIVKDLNYSKVYIKNIMNLETIEVLGVSELNFNNKKKLLFIYGDSIEICDFSCVLSDKEAFDFQKIKQIKEQIKQLEKQLKALENK